jgi:hypothetical protein
MWKEEVKNIFSSTKNKEETFCPYNKTSPSIRRKWLFKVKSSLLLVHLVPVKELSPNLCLKRTE